MLSTGFPGLHEGVTAVGAYDRVARVIAAFDRYGRCHAMKVRQRWLWAPHPNVVPVFHRLRIAHTRPLGRRQGYPAAVQQLLLGSVPVGTCIPGAVEAC
jgi:hypothetical protein